MNCWQIMEIKYNTVQNGTVTGMVYCGILRYSIYGIELVFSHPH